MKNKLKTCTRCLTPETHETLVFDENNICNICNQQDFKNTKIDWSKKKIELDEIILKYKDKTEYDCIVPFSGGKDSTWTLYYIVEKLKLKPLVVRFDHGFLRPNLNNNTKKIINSLGVTLHDFTPNWKVVQKLMLQTLIEKGDFCWHCHTGIFAYPMWVALRNQIPLVIWGEPSSEYTAYYSYDQSEEVDEKRFNRYINLGISADDMLVRLEGLVEERDLQPFKYPPTEALKSINFRSICLGSYIPWDAKKQSEFIQKSLGWKGDEVENVPPQYKYEKIECYMQGVRDYIKYIKRGYSRVTHLSSIDIRNNRISREEGSRLIKEFEGKRPPSLDIFLDYVGLVEEEFNEIVLEHAVSPYAHNFKEQKKGKKTHDFDKWIRKDPMAKEDSKIQLERWKKHFN